MAMKLQRAVEKSVYQITHFLDQGIIINGSSQYSHSIWLSPKVVEYWRPKCMLDLTQQDFRPLLDYKPKPEIILLGTGIKQHFPTHDKLLGCIQQQISVEVMTTEKAGATFNLLAAEGRQVLAALIWGG